VDGVAKVYLTQQPVFGVANGQYGVFYDGSISSSWGQVSIAKAVIPSQTTSCILSTIPTLLSFSNSKKINHNSDKHSSYTKVQLWNMKW